MHFTTYLSLLDEIEVFHVKKSNHSKKIVKQLKKEYKEDLEKTSCTIPDQNTRIGTILFFFSCMFIDQSQGTAFYFEENIKLLFFL